MHEQAWAQDFWIADAWLANVTASGLLENQLLRIQWCHEEVHLAAKRLLKHEHSTTLGLDKFAGFKAQVPFFGDCGCFGAAEKNKHTNVTAITCLPVLSHLANSSDTHFHFAG